MSGLSLLIVGAIVAVSAVLVLLVLSRHVNRDSYRTLPAWAVVVGVVIFVGLLCVSAYLTRNLV